MENDEDDTYNPLAGCLTVGELIEKLQAFAPNLPVMGAYRGRIRENEYFDISPHLSDLGDQETGGDPERYGAGEVVLITNQKALC